MAETESVDHGDLPEVPEATGGGTATVTVDDVTEAMKDVVDPELGINVVDLGLVYGVHLDDGVVSDVSYDAVGCSISQASASVLAELLIGKPVDDAMEIHEHFLTLMQGKGQVEPDEEVLEDGVAFAGVAKFPARVKCALLSWMAWKDATAQATEERLSHG
jgi:nitrogen fixation NifU-like protein